MSSACHWALERHLGQLHISSAENFLGIALLSLHRRLCFIFLWRRRGRRQRRYCVGIWKQHWGKRGRGLFRIYEPEQLGDRIRIVSNIAIENLGAGRGQSHPNIRRRFPLIRAKVPRTLHFDSVIVQL